MTTSTINNGTTKTKNKKKREEKRQREQQNVDTRDGSGVTDNNPQTGPDKRDTDYARSPEGQKNGQSQPEEQEEQPEEQVKDSRHHGPYASIEEARQHPVHYQEGKNKGKILSLYTVSLANYPTQYWYGMNYHHAAIQYLKNIGGTVSLCGSGRGSAMVAANNRATEAEMRAAQALQAKLDAENAQFTQLVLLVKACGPVALTTIQDVELRQRVESAIAQG